MGATDRDMQREKILVFGINILNLLGSLGKGPKREEKPYLFDVKIFNFFPEISPKNTSKPPQYQLHSNDNLP